MKQTEQKDWIKLDNAANIYPSTMSKKYAAMFRMTITLTEEIDKNILKQALLNIMKRFPTFNYQLKQGLFWNYLKKINNNPKIEKDFNNPMVRINFKNNNYYMFRVRYYKKRIAVEYFHALTDGYGGMTFLLTLTSEYLKIKHNIKIDYSKMVLNPNDKPSIDETSDQFNKYKGNYGKIFFEKSAYHDKYPIISQNKLNIITGTININELKELCKKYNCTITTFISSLLIDCYQDIQKNNKKPIKISIPVNLRNIYETNTMRNFSSYINVGIEPKYGKYELEEIINIVKSKMNLLLNKKIITSKITANINATRNPFFRIIPMFIKKYFLSICESFMGDRYFTIQFSNIGNINLPKEMTSYIDKIGFILGKSRKNMRNCAVASCNNKMFISFSSKTDNTDIERLFFTKLVEMNIKVEIESNIGGQNVLY